MAYEASEIMTANALRWSNKVGNTLSSVRTYDDLLLVIADSIEYHKNNKQLNFGTIQFADMATRKGFVKNFDLFLIENPDTQQKKKMNDLLTDMAVGVSAAIAIRNLMKLTSGEITTYMTGNIWPNDVSKFQVSAFGFTDYNSSDIVVSSNIRQNFYGISLKKKPTVKSNDPTLINKAFSSAFEVNKEDNKEVYEKFNRPKTGLIAKLINTRTNYFAGIVKDAVMGDGTHKNKSIILEQDIKEVDFKKLQTPKNLSDVPSNDMQELFQSKKKDLTRFEKKRAYIDTKGFATKSDGKSNPNGYFDKGNSMTDPNSMRAFVNSKLAERPNPLWTEMMKIMDAGADVLGNHLINIVLKSKLYKEIEAKDLDNVNFQFALITGIGNVKDSKTGRTATISRAKTITLKTTLCGLDRIDNNYKGNYKVIQDIEATNKSDAAKVYFKLVKGSSPSIDVLDLELRYKGSFTPQPQFQAGITDTFKKLLDKECSGGPG